MTRCITPGCPNQPRSLDARLCNTCKALNDAARLERERERARNKPRSETTCKRPGCDNVHHGRSRYCLEHIKQPRGANAELQRTGTIGLARELLRADDPPQRLRPLQRVTRWNVVTGQIEERWE